MKSFKWVHDRLKDKFGFVIVIPPIPEWNNYSQATEDDIMELRRQELQSFVNRVTRHPVLSVRKGLVLFQIKVDSLVQWSRNGLEISFVVENNPLKLKKNFSAVNESRSFLPPAKSGNFLFLRRTVR